MSLLREDPQKVDTSLKEAVADSFLNILGARVRGAGEFGQVLYGTKPSSALVSGFLLPRKAQDDGDEVTSPIWISGQGLDFQLTRTGSGKIRLSPKFSVYVRVWPTEADLKEREDCRLRLRMRREVANRLRQRFNEALAEAWEPYKSAYRWRGECPEWPKIHSETQEKVRNELGLPLDIEFAPVPEHADAPPDLPGPTDEEDAAEGEMLEEAQPPEKLINKCRDEDFEPIDVPQKWRRLDLELPVLELDPRADADTIEAALRTHETDMKAAVGAQLHKWAQDTDPETGGVMWAYKQGARLRPSEYQDWARCLAALRANPAPPALPDITLRWDIDVASDWMNPSRLNVHLAVENQSALPSRDGDSVDHSLFDASLTVTLPRAEHSRLRLERVEPSYRYNRHLTYAAIGFNAGVVERDAGEGEVALVTTWAPRYHQPRIVPRVYPGVVRNMRALAAPSCLAGLAAIPTAFQDWLTQVPVQTPLDVGIEHDTAAIDLEKAQFAKDLTKWSLEGEAIGAGLALLEESATYWNARGPQADPRAAPFEAWLAMNESMANLMKLKLPDDSAQWRLFQLAFILANLPSIVTRMPEFAHHFDKSRDDAVTLLYFPTGGGKSEAFFGLLLFTLFLDRLRGKAKGVTAMIRYPLRLLTIQQAQRAARVLAQAEMIRQDRGYGGDTFAIGFWVGSSGSPNWHRSKGVTDVPDVKDVAVSEDKLREEDANYTVANKAWNKLPSCPFCGSATGLRRFASNGGTLAHICTSTACRCNAGGPQPLPFYICDEDIYDLAPSVLLGTVDKLALIGHTAKTIRCILGMLGTAPWYDPSTGRLHMPTQDELRAGPGRGGYETVFPAYETGQRLFHDPYPALVIQDEAHLLDESLGSFAGLFESTFEAMLGSLAQHMHGIVASTAGGTDFRRAKVVAASATVSHPERQLEHLYQRSVPSLQFPYPGPNLHRSFYAEPEDPPADEPARIALGEDMVETRAKLARIYCGLMTNGRPHTTTTTTVLAHFHLTVTELLDALCSDDDERRMMARAQLTSHLSPTPIQADLARKLQAAKDAELATLVDLHRISLTYVTNKKGGDQIMAAESEEVRKLHKAAGYALDALVTRLITGSVEQGEIQATVEEAQRRPPPGAALELAPAALRSVIATSAVSHGVDVEELNAMFFAGMPSDIAEYIQASSRVGRTHVGFCVLIPTPQRRRDRYIVEVFDIFHRFLERMVQPAAIDRWATKAIMRVVPSVFQAGVCGTSAVREFIKTDEAEKDQWRENAYIRDFLPKYLADKIGYNLQIATFFYRAIGLSPEFSPEAEAFYKSELHARIRKLLDDMSSEQNRQSSLSDFFRQFSDNLQKPMTSLRDVDQAGELRLARKGWRGEALKPEEARELMAFVRRGYAEAGDDE